MTQKKSKLPRLLIGILLSVLFLYLAFNKIDYSKMLAALQKANYWYLIPAVFVQLFAHWVRGIRWRYFLEKIKAIPVSSLFSATMIGYMGNTVLPAHLGEFIRANVIAKREKIPIGSVLATILLERIIDILSLLIVMVATLLIYPFPEWVKISGFLMLAGILALFAGLVLLKFQLRPIMALLDFFLGLLPKFLSERLRGILMAFLEGINGFPRKRDYFITLMLSMAIWAGYWGNLHFCFFAFNFFETYQISAVASVVLLVITTISVVVPSSPGYIGTYHYLCQLSLELFGVPRPVGLSFAFVAWGISIIPTALIGFFLAWREGLSRLRTTED